MKSILLWVQAFFAYVRDRRLFNNGVLEHPSELTKFWILNHIRRATKSTVLIESGTFHGGTASRCAQFFDAVYTIELDADLAAKAKRFLSAWKNVELIQGDAVHRLPELLARKDIRRAIIFLDGHYSGVGTAQGNVPEPALEELRILAGFADQLNAIVVDDFRCFGTLPGFPTQDALLQTARDLFKNQPFDLHVTLDQLTLIRRQGI